jgi:hypothetical protein
MKDALEAFVRHNSFCMNFFKRSQFLVDEYFKVWDYLTYLKKELNLTQYYKNRYIA